MNGGIYKAAPYSPVEANSAPANRAIPSGSTAVNGVYFLWNEKGFTGTGWFLTPGSPLWDSGLTTVAAVDDYLSTNDNLNEVFSAWNPSFYEFMDWAENFREDGKGAGCADFDISVTE